MAKAKVYNAKAQQPGGWQISARVVNARADATLEELAGVDASEPAPVQVGPVVEIDVYDYVVPANFFVDTVSAKGVREVLKANPNATTIKVRINSAGGDVYDGMAIYNQLKDHNAKVVVQVDGLCASIASIIAMAGDEIKMSEGAWMMIHCPYSAFTVEQRSDDLRKTADALDKMADSMAAVYSARTGQSKDAVLAAMQAETWMTADEALDAGYCTEIIPALTPVDEDEVPADAKAMLAKLTLDFKRAPSGAVQAMKHAHQYHMVAYARAAAARAEADDENEDKAKVARRALEDEIDDLKAKLAEAQAEATKAKEDMKKAKDELAEFKKKGDDEDDDEESDSDTEARAESQALAKLGLTVRALTGAKDLREAEAKVLALAGQVDKFKQLEGQVAVLAKERHVARVSDLIAKGQLLPERKDWALAASDADLDTYLTATGGAQLAPLGHEHKEGTPTAQRPAAGAADPNRPISKEERTLAKALGLTDEQIIAARSRKLAAVNELPA